MYQNLFQAIIVIITGKAHARTWSWLQDDASQFYLVPFSNPSGSKYFVVHGLSLLLWSKLFNGVLFVFPSDRRFSHCRQQSSPMINLWAKLWQRDRINIIGLKELYRQKNTDFESYLLVKLQSLFKFSTIFFLNASKLQLRNVHFQQQQNILYFLFLLCKI